MVNPFNLVADIFAIRTTENGAIRMAPFLMSTGSAARDSLFARGAFGDAIAVLIEERTAIGTYGRLEYPGIIQRKRSSVDAELFVDNSGSLNEFRPGGFYWGMG